MKARFRYHVVAMLSLSLLLVFAEALSAQGRGNSDRDRATLDVQVTFSVGERERLVEHYVSASHPPSNALPPGIRKNLARGKALPPGIAKRSPPPELLSVLSVPRGYEVVEVGLDVLLVEVATGVIHDVLMDVIR